MSALPGLALLLATSLLSGLHVCSEGDSARYEPALIDGIRDPVFAYLVSMARDGACGELSGEELSGLVQRSGMESRLPHGLLEAVTRVSGATGRPLRLSVRFREAVDVPIPYSILGYHPGSVRISRDLQLDEWRLGRLRLPGEVKGERRYLEEVRLLVVRAGSVDVDIDWWVDKLFGGKLDDNRVIAFALARHEEHYIGIATGLNGSGQGRSGTFDFHQDEIVFPSPRHLKYAGRNLRQRALRLLEREEASAKNRSE